MNEPTQSPIAVIERQNAEPSTGAEPDQDELLVEEDLLVEEVSIDGMCGVY
jgi:mycofactocin precursor